MDGPNSPLPTADAIIAQLPQPVAFGWVQHTPGSSSAAQGEGQAAL
ncbi:MAG TPA: hypothetical protein VIM98_14090 [Dyella sp.]